MEYVIYAQLTSFQINYWCIFPRSESLRYNILTCGVHTCFNYLIILQMVFSHLYLPKVLVYSAFHFYSGLVVLNRIRNLHDQFCIWNESLNQPCTKRYFNIFFVKPSGACVSSTLSSHALSILNYLQLEFPSINTNYQRHVFTTGNQHPFLIFFISDHNFQFALFSSSWLLQLTTNSQITA